MVILGLVFLLFLFFFGVMFMMALGAQNMRETIEEEEAERKRKEEAQD
ncbi:MAG: hypothetical protein RIR52_2010 [Acidobacteriota bacterium]|jgi:Na+-transporting methylmalonyl-CoA/oxaloacetate decarboxylase gamma subunit